MRKYLFLLILLLLIPSVVWGACSETSSNSHVWNCDCSYDSLSGLMANAALDADDVVNVAEGTETWAATLQIRKPIKLKGAGVSNTVITANGYSIGYNPIKNLSYETKMLQIDGFSLSGVILLTDNENNSDIAWSPAASETGTVAKTKIVIGNNSFARIQVDGTFWGVIHNNTVTGTGNVVQHTSNGATDYNNLDGDTDNFIYGHTDAESKMLYFEDNTLTGTSTYFFSETGTGSRWVWRYNTNTGSVVQGNPFLDAHGCQDSGNPGAMMVEIYGNIFSFTGSTQKWYYQRGGKTLMFNNINYHAGSGTDPIYQEEGADTDPATECTGVDTPGLVNPHESYFWNNYIYYPTDQKTRQAVTVSTDTYDRLGPDESYWDYNADCSGSAGCASGVGTGASAPTGNCTEGVGFWVTNYTTANMPPESLADMRTYCQGGDFYICTATNTWTKYELYTYPHPLIDEAGGETTTTTAATTTSSTTTSLEPTTTSSTTTSVETTTTTSEPTTTTSEPTTTTSEPTTTSSSTTTSAAATTTSSVKVIVHTGTVNVGTLRIGP